MKLGPVDVGQFLIGAGVVVLIVVLWMLFVLWALRQIFGDEWRRP